MQRLNQELLDSMTKQEKRERTSYESFKERWNVIKGTNQRRISKNEMPYTEYNNKKVIDHLTIRSGENNDIRRLLENGSIIIDEYREKGYTIVINPPKNQSVPSRPHIHLLLLE